jgi:arginine decarboxylase
MNPNPSASLVQALSNHQQKRPVSFHVPGHKSGKAYSRWAADPVIETFLTGGLEWDQTEIDGLDDLHAPEEAILEAQKRAAEAYGADSTYFLVNGSTVGNLAMIHTVCRQGDRVLVQRNSHKSIFHALALVGARPIFLNPRVESITGIPTGVTPEHVKGALEAYPDTRAVILTSPNYYGMAMDLAKIAEICHKHAIPLVVDEAHGAHCGFHADYPASALGQGADLVVQSTHKMGLAMTMGACLHTQGERFDKEKLHWYLSVFQSSSPSYPIMASIDLSTYFMTKYGKLWLTEAKQMVEAFYQQMKPYEDLFYIPKYMEKNSSYEAMDPLKLTIHFHYGQDGFSWRDRLQKEGIFLELAQERHTLAVLGPGTNQNDMDRFTDSLIRSVESMKPVIGQENLRGISNIVWNKEPWEAMEHPLTQVIPANMSAVPWRQAIGKISGEIIIPYPPGVPILHVGERWTLEKMQWIQIQKDKGLKFQGVSDSSLETVRVLPDA